MKLFDTHAHLYDKAFDNDRETMLAGVFDVCDYVVCPAEDVASSEAALSLAQKYPQIYAAVGIHPQLTKDATEEALAAIRKLAEENEKVVAIGEIGLDYYYLYSEIEVQKTWFARQIELAKELDLPIIIHDRDAHGDMMDILRAHKDAKLRGILHCYSGSLEMAEELIEMGFYISFAGPLTFKKAPHLWDAARAVPPERLLVETDSPYLSPEPLRGRRNEPANVVWVLKKLAALREIPEDEMARITFENARRFYRLPD